MRGAVASTLRRRLWVMALIVIGALAAVSPAVASAAPWAETTNLSDSVNDNGIQEVAIDPNGNAFAVWAHLTGNGSYVQASTRPAGGKWSAPVQLSPFAEEISVLDPDVAVDAAGNAIATWTQYEYGGSYIRASTRPAGGEWSAPIDLTPYVRPPDRVNDPSVAMDPAGDATVAWTEIGRETSVLRTRTLPAGAKEWTAPEIASPSGWSFQSQPVLVDAGGDTALVWLRNATIQSKPTLEAALRPAGEGWQPAVALPSTANNLFMPRAGIDGAGNVTVAWQSFGEGGANIESADVTAGGGWGTPTVVEALPGSEPEFLALAENSSGEAMVTYEAYEPGSFTTRVRVATRPAGGTWQSPVILSPAGIRSVASTIAIDSAGNATMLWRSQTVEDCITLQVLKKPAGGEWSAPVDLTPALRGFFIDEQAIEGPVLAVNDDGDAAVAWLKRGEGRFESTIQATTAETDNPPHLADASVTPNLWGGLGGTSTITAKATDDRGVAQAYAIVTGPSGGKFKVGLEGLNSEYEGAYHVPANVGTVPRTYSVTVFAEDTTGQLASGSAGTITVEPSGTPNPGYLRFEPGSLRFGAHSIAAGETTVRTVVLSDEGKPGSPAISGTVKSSSPEFTLVGGTKDGLAFTVAPGSPQTIEVAFTPSAKGQREGRLTLVRTDGRSQPNAGVALFGWGVK
jgi:hypothetical protein